MANGLVRLVARIIFWTYPRGSWQYDIMCGLILVFIFLTPRPVFDGSFLRPDPEPVEAVETEVLIDHSPEMEPAVENASAGTRRHAPRQ